MLYTLAQNTGSNCIQQYISSLSRFSGTIKERRSIARKNKTKHSIISLAVPQKSEEKEKKIKAEPATFHFVIQTSVQLHSGSTRA